MPDGKILQLDLGRMMELLLIINNLLDRLNLKKYFKFRKMKDFSIRCNNISEFIKMQEYFFKKNIFWCDNDHKILTSNQLYPAWICFQGNAFYYSIYNPIGEIIIDYKQFMRQIKFKKLYQI